MIFAELAERLTSDSMGHKHGAGADGWQCCPVCLKACARGDADSHKKAVAAAILEELA